MSGWKYRTRGKEPPQGLPQVYLCCDPRDFGEYFVRFADEILKNIRCAIWYIDADTPRDQDFFTMLSSMDLVVALVTENFLAEGSVVMDKDISFILEDTAESRAGRAIPFLPLVLSSVAETIYKNHEKLKKIQYICTEQQEGFAQPYQEKLKAYLEEVLINSALMERIRGAFDAYIFFSYRKKDHVPAQNDIIPLE